MEPVNISLQSDWVVIEGDNGTGKDTLADRFERSGWLVVSRDRRAVSACENARHYSGMDFVNAFLDYNRLCSEIVDGSNRPAVLVRYWPSTINGAFADGVISDVEHEELLKKCLHDYLLPNAFVFLTCNFEARCDRIQNRGPVSVKDDMSDSRNFIYLSSADRCSDLIPRWHTVSSQKTPDELYENIQQLLKGLRA